MHVSTCTCAVLTQIFARSCTKKDEISLLSHLHNPSLTFHHPVACNFKQNYWTAFLKLFRMSDVPVHVNMLLSDSAFDSTRLTQDCDSLGVTHETKGITETGGETEEQKKKSQSALLMQCTVLGELKS